MWQIEQRESTRRIFETYSEEEISGLDHDRGYYQ